MTSMRSNGFVQVALLGYQGAPSIDSSVTHSSIAITLRCQLIYV